MLSNWGLKCSDRKGREGNVIADYELGERNEGGSQLVEFCMEQET